MDDEYLLGVIREQGRQIGQLAMSVQLLANANNQLLARIQLLEAGRAIEEMEERRTVN